MNDFASNALDPAIRRSDEAAAAAPPLPLALHLAVHIATLVVAWSLLAAADSWTVLSGLGVAKLLSIITGALAGGLLVTTMHEWFHLLGAKLGKAEIRISSKPGLILFHWSFPSNSVQQFMAMSLCGAAGGLLGVLLLFTQLSPDTVGRTAVLAAATGFFAFAATLEWPVIWRTRISRDAGAEYATITPSIVSGCAIVGLLTATATFLALS
jgi:hypothetical protein